MRRLNINDYIKKSHIDNNHRVFDAIRLLFSQRLLTVSSQKVKADIRNPLRDLSVGAFNSH